MNTIKRLNYEHELDFYEIDNNKNLEYYYNSICKEREYGILDYYDDFDKWELELMLNY